MKLSGARKGPILLLGVGVLAIVAGTAWWHAGKRPALSFTSAAVKRGNIAATIGATGTIEPLEVVDVGAQVAGRISAFGKDKEGKTVDYGSVVEEGALLAKIDESVYAADLAVANAQMERDKAAVLSAEADILQSKAKFLQAEADWQRASELNRAKLLATADFDTAKANYEVAKANVAVSESALAQAKASTVEARAAVEKAQRNLDFCTINSPVSGVIIDRRVNIGQTVVASLNAPSLFLIARDLTRMQIWAAVNEADVGRVKPGTPVTFTVDAYPGREFQGVVGKVRLNATMTQNVVLYTVEINIDNSDKVLLPYLTASVRFVLCRETNALLVPNAALRWSPSSLAEVAPDARQSPLVDPPGEAPATNAPAQKRAADKPSKRTLWLKAGDYVRPVEVSAGISDGVNTLITSDAVREGDEAVTGEIAARQADVKSPFLPKFIRR